MKFYLLNLFLFFCPATRFFALKRFTIRLLGVEVGEGTRVCGDVKFFGAGRVKLGSNCWIGIGSKFYTRLESITSIGDNCDVAPEVIFINGSHEMGGKLRRAGIGTYANIVVGDGCWLGSRAVVLGGADIECSSVFAAGSVVLGGKYPSSQLFAGVPARFVRHIE